MSQDKNFTLYTSAVGLNGWKVAFVLEELGLSYDSVYLNLSKDEHKRSSYTEMNPNGRIPTLVDHQNGDLAIWESNAIIIYLVDMYDKQNIISVSDPNGKILQIQWLFFQASGQGPYYGQAGWFILQHPERIPSAIDRYAAEIRRILGVLETVLSKQDWLVGGKMTVADLSFVMYNEMVATRLSPSSAFDLQTEFPAVFSWHRKMRRRDAVNITLGIKDSLNFT